MRIVALIISVFFIVSCGSSEGVDGPSPNTPVDAIGGDLGVDTVLGELSGPVDVPNASDEGQSSDNAQVFDLGAPQDINEDCEPGTGCSGEACEENSDCISGICVMHMGERVCSQTCIEECPPGWSCLAVDLGSADPLFVCVSNHSHLCQPCKESGDCAGLAGANSCMDYGLEGAFCGATCDDDHPCPEGYLCEMSSTIEGGESRQCVNAAGVCECTDTAVSLALATSCNNTNEFGICTGERICSEEGLSQCDAATPGTEVCNGVDDDCDGLVDEVFCDDGNSCTQDQCMGLDGCVFEPITGGSCDDDDHCTEQDTCTEGVCLGTPILCDDNDLCTDEACDAQLGCQITGFNEAPCDDGDNCTINDQCANGDCMSGTALECDDGKDCTVDSCGDDGHCLHDPAEGNCDDGNFCTTGDSCVAGACVATGNLNCDDDEICTSDSCEPSLGCTNTPVNATCDDGEICTIGDSCINGSCSGTGNLDCDDDDSCTSDFCEPGLGCSHTPLPTCCGNGIVEEGEDCDDGNDDNNDDCNNLCLDHAPPSVCDNLGPMATPTHSSGGSSTPYLPYQMNNGLVEDDSCDEWAWIDNSEVASGGWFMFEWSTPQTIGGFVVDTVNYEGTYGVCADGGAPAGRNLLSGEVQIWDGASWQTVATWADELDDFKVAINPPVNSTKLRLYNINTSPGNGNSIIFEWFVYDSPLCLP